MTTQVPIVPYSQFLDEADTGDVVLWTGTSPISLAVEAATFSWFSHSSMVIRDPKTRTKYLFQSVSEALAADPLSTQQVSPHDGVQAGRLEEVMPIVYKAGDYPTWSRLQWANRPVDLDTTLWELARGMDGHRFPFVYDPDKLTSGELTIKLMLDLLDKGRVLHEEVLEPIFCSGLVAYMLQGAGILEKSLPPNGYEPRDFSSQFSGPAVYTSGVNYQPDVAVQMP